MRLAFGYFKKHFLMTDAEVAARRRAIVDCSSAHDYALSALFIDELETAPRELHKALRTIIELDERVLIVPSLLHFAESGNPLEFRQSLESQHIKLLLSEVPSQAERTC